MKIIDLLNKIAHKENVPKKIKYKMFIEGWDIFTYDEEEQEYYNRAGEDLRVPNHHLNDAIEIVEE